MSQTPIGATVGANVRAEMARRNIGQDQLAAELKVHRTTVSSWLSGRREISLSDLERVAQYLEVRIIDLF